MATTCWVRSSAPGRILSVVLLVLVGFLLAASSTTGQSTQNIEVFAADGILQSRGRAETQYRDMRQGTAPLVSGSFIRTGDGPADILFANNTILCLDGNTEVQVGLYENGIWIYQYSGRAYHIVEPDTSSVHVVHVVQSAFYTARAIGTEYRTMVNYPVEGAVLVAWGEIGVVVPPWTDPVTGRTWPGLTGFVPEGYKIVEPINEDVITVDPGYRVYHPSQSDKIIRGEKVIPPPDDNWTRERRDLGRTVRDLRQRHARGLLSNEVFRQKMLLALGFRPDSLPPEPMGPEGGLWIGQADYLIVTLCISNSVVNEMHIVDAWIGWDKQTGETYSMFVDFTLSGVALFLVEQGSRIDGSYTVTEGIWKGATVDMRGAIGGQRGRVWISVHSETDVAIYSGSIEVVDIQLLDPHGCDF